MQILLGVLRVLMFEWLWLGIMLICVLQHTEESLLLAYFEQDSEESV